MFNYIQNIYNFYKNSVKEKQSLTDILNSFSELSDNYNKINTIKEQISNKYSSVNLAKCTLDEQHDFIDNILQPIKSLVTNSIYETDGILWTLKDAFTLVVDKNYYNIEKTKRKVIYSALSTHRPTGEMAFDTWNGLQIIDLDIKNEELANKIKPLLFEHLSNYSWFIGVIMSASKRSLHVWTKINPYAINHNECKIEFTVNFRHKYSYIYMVLLQISEQVGITKEDIQAFMDMAMSKPQQGIFIGSDLQPLINTNFNNLGLDINFESAYNNGIESINWISHPDLKTIFRKLEWFNNNDVPEKIEIQNIENINDRDISKNKKIHYKHAQRWQLANTLTSLFGETQALKLISDICLDTPYRELQSDIKTASLYNKPISSWAVKELNKNHGFKINIKKDEEYASKEIENISKKIEQEVVTEDPTKIINDGVKKTILHLKSNQYLSDIKEDIIANLGKITLLEAGAGYGKTEMIKSLKERTLLILPFTSTIKSKVESSEVTKDWLYFYGNKRPTLEQLLGHNNISMTIDKFSRLNVMELDQANFKYIVIDESHLLYTSSYRDVMSPTIQRLANCSAKIIMMTGTPTGEMLFFPGIKNIKVIKEDLRTKEVEFHMCQTNDEKLIMMCEHMADDILDGKKIIYPSNNGNLYYEQMIGILSKILEDKGYDKPLKSFYYKKSNYGNESMIDIEVNKSIGQNDLIVCTNYLSVGVDICDKYDFTVYFSQLWIPQDIEQFANRIRNNDLYIKIFLEKYGPGDNRINYNITNPLNLKFDNSTLLLIKDLIRTCNDMLERNEEESKYNPIISSLLSTNKYIKYDENDAKYYVDETAFKLKIFEERYSEYSKQLNVLTNDLKYYGYTINIIDHKEVISEDNMIIYDQLKKECRNHHFCENTVKTFKFLNHINDENIDDYKDILKGSYGILTDDEYKEKREEKNLYVEDLEIVLKYLPIYLTLYNFYDPKTIIDIFSYCKDKHSNRINNSLLQRIRKFVIIEDNRRKNHIDFPVYKFIVDAQLFAKEHPYVSKLDIETWLANYTAKICNVVKDVVVDDKDYMEVMYELLKELFDVIVIKKNSKQSTIHIEPFELIWEKKVGFNDLYKFGGYVNTKEFFLQDLIDNMKTEDESDNYIKEYQLPHTEKFRLDDIKDQIENIITKPFNYFEYSQLDGSNMRFMRKQKNTNQLRDNIFDMIEENEDNDNNDINNEQIDLFS